MCHIFYCIALSIDLVQRLITYAFACFLFVIIFFLLFASLIAGMTYGYKYYVAEYHTINSTFESIRQIAMYPQAKLSEFDPKYYKELRAYYKFMSTSTEAPPVQEKNITASNSTGNSTDNSGGKPSETTTPRLRFGKPGVMKNFKFEDDVDRNDFDKVVPIDRPTVSPFDDKSGIKDYVKKLNWVVSEDNRNMASGRQEHNKKDKDESLSNQLDSKSKLRYLVKLNEKNTNLHTDPNKYSEYSGFPVRNVIPIRPMEPRTKPSEKGPEVPPKPVYSKDLVLMRRTVDNYDFANISDSKSKSWLTTTTKKSVVLDILEKKLMSINNVTTTDRGKRASTVTTTDIPPKQYMQILNWLLSQKNKFKTSTEKEKIILV